MSNDNFFDDGENTDDYLDKIEDISNGAVVLNHIVKRKILQIAKKVRESHKNDNEK